MRKLIALFLFLPAAGYAEFVLLKDDRALTREEVVSMTGQHLIEFFEGGQSRYSVGGSYSYTYRGGGTAYGRYNIGADGTICILFRNGRDRCDRFVQSHGRLVMITQTGDRFPIRP